MVISRWPQVHEEPKASTAIVELQNGNTDAVRQRYDSFGVLEGFDTNAALLLLEQEFREVVSFFASPLFLTHVKHLVPKPILGSEKNIDMRM